MVGHKILDLVVMVRIHAGQKIISNIRTGGSLL